MGLTDKIELTRTISPAQHAALDYGVAATFFTLGMRYRNRNRAASVLAFINGGMVLGMSLLTDYPGGLWSAISFKTHGTMDLVQAALAGCGPTLFGFSDTPEARSSMARRSVSLEWSRRPIGMRGPDSRDERLHERRRAHSGVIDRSATNCAWASAATSDTPPITFPRNVGMK